MELIDWTYYAIILVIFTSLDIWFIHRNVENESDRWSLFIIVVLVADIAIAMLDRNSRETWGVIFVGFLIALAVHRIALNLIKQRERNRRLINNRVDEQIKEIESYLSSWKAR